MDTTDRFLVVEAHALDDLCELSAKAAGFLERASSHDPLVSAMRGAIAQVRSSVVPEP